MTEDDPVMEKRTSEEEPLMEERTSEEEPVTAERPMMDKRTPEEKPVADERTSIGKDCGGKPRLDHVVGAHETNARGASLDVCHDRCVGHSRLRHPCDIVVRRVGEARRRGAALRKQGGCAEDQDRGEDY